MAIKKFPQNHLPSYRRKVDFTCNPVIAEKHTGYKVGGTSPFGTKKAMPVYMESTIADLPEIFY